MFALLLIPVSYYGGFDCEKSNSIKLLKAHAILISKQLERLLGDPQHRKKMISFPFPNIIRQLITSSDKNHLDILWCLYYSMSGTWLMIEENLFIVKGN